MNKYPLVSILVNCYNSELYLRDCLKSLVNQTYDNLEIVVWDNKSVDNTKNITESFKDPRIKYYLSSSHKNLVDSRINAWKYLNGKYVAILDSDDIACENRIKLQLEMISSNEKLAVIGGGVQYIDNHNNLLSKKIYISNSKKIYELIYSEFIMNNSTLFFDKIKVDKVGGYSNRFIYINDYELVYRLSKRYEIDNHPKIVSQNRIHKDSLTNLKCEPMELELLKFLQEINAFTPNILLRIKNKISILKCKYRILRSKII